MKSIIQTNKECFLKDCKCSGRLEEHHIFNGPMRDKAERFGLKVYLCSYHHTMGGKDCVHDNPDLKTRLKQLRQHEFELLYGHEMFMKQFRKNYL